MSFLTLDRNTPTHLLEDMFHIIQSDAIASDILTVAVRNTVEFVEDKWNALRWYSNTVISNLDAVDLYSDLYVYGIS